MLHDAGHTSVAGKRKAVGGQMDFDRQEGIARGGQYPQSRRRSFLVPAPVSVFFWTGKRREAALVVRPPHSGRGLCRGTPTTLRIWRRTSAGAAQLRTKTDPSARNQPDLMSELHRFSAPRCIFDPNGHAVSASISQLRKGSGLARPSSSRAAEPAALVCAWITRRGPWKREDPDADGRRAWHHQEHREVLAKARSLGP